MAFRKHIGWVVGALLLQIVAVIVSSILDSHFGNFVLHSLGGGAAITLVFTYFLKTFDIKVNWRLLTVAAFAVVCAFGVINELGEFAGEMVGVGQFSFDTHDTWRDLFANTAGMIVAWLVILIFHAVRKEPIVRP
ncbi:MAG TPA: hypothetical protein VLG13_01050 [Patescibacteria group bacterium]|nr:hypothetical protein [Patescibacteria group bacterium]